MNETAELASTTLNTPKTESSTSPDPLPHASEPRDAPDTSDASPTALATVDPSRKDNQMPSPIKEDGDDDGDDEEGLAARCLEKDSSDFERATISIVLQLLPHDQHPDGRPVIIGIRSHNLTPLTLTRRLGQLTPLPTEIQRLLDNWHTHYPQALTERDRTRAAHHAREQAKLQQQKEDRQRKQDELKAQRAAQKSPQTKKKRHSAPSLHPAPGGDGSVCIMTSNPKEQLTTTAQAVPQPALF